MSDQTQELSPVVEGDVVSAVETSGTLSEVVASLGDTLTSEAIASAVEGSEADRNAWRTRAVGIGVALDRSLSVTSAYMVRLEDDIARKSGKDQADYDDIVAAYRNVVADPKALIRKDRISQLRNTARIVIDCGFPMGDPDAPWFTSKAPTGMLPAAAIADAVKLAAEAGKPAAIAHLRAERVKADAKREEKRALEAQKAADAEKGRQARLAAEAESAAKADTASGSDTASTPPKDEAKREPKPEGNGKPAPMEDTYHAAIDAMVSLPQDEAEGAAYLIALAEELAVIVAAIPAATMAKAREILEARKAADEAATKGRRTARKATPATVRKAAKS